MKYLNVFDSKDKLDASVGAIKHKDGAFVFAVDTSTGMENITYDDERHPGAHCYTMTNVNMTPLTIDESSVEKSIAIGTILYETADGKLVLDETTNNVKNTPIAISTAATYNENFETGEEIDGNANYYKFIGIYKLDPDNPGKTTQYYASVQYGNYGTSVGSTKGASYYGTGGKYNTQKLIEAATNQDKLVCSGIAKEGGVGYSPAATCCVAYRTKATKSGDWYLPSKVELTQALGSTWKSSMNNAKKKATGSEFGSDEVWSSTEIDTNQAYTVTIFGNANKVNKIYSKSVYPFLVVYKPEQS